MSDPIDAIVLQLADPDPAVREQAENRLTEAGAAARPALLRGSKHDSPEIARRSREILRVLPWDIESDPPAARTLLRGYGERETAARAQVVQQLFALGDHAGFAALARLIVEDSDSAVQWRIAQTFREGTARLSLAEANSLTLAADNPAALCLAGWSNEKTDFPRAMQLYELAIHEAVDRDEGCLDELAPVFDTLVAVKQFKHEYDSAADLLRTRWTLSLRESDNGVDCGALDELFALHAMHGPLTGFGQDVRENVVLLARPQELYSLGKMCENHRAIRAATVIYELAYLRGAGSPATREEVGEFLMEQNWTDLAERELVAITQSWFSFGATVDSARMRLGLLHANEGDDEAAAKYLALALPGLHNRSVWLSLQHGERHFYGRGAENFLWTLQHFHAMRFAISQHDDHQAEAHALELAKLGTDDPAMVIAAVPILKSEHHPEEAKALFMQAYTSARRGLDDSSDDPRTLNNIAWLCAVCQEKLDEALPLAERAAALDPSDATILDTLAEIHFARGENKQAIDNARRALEINPDSTYLKRQLNRFELSMNPAH